jgi:argininosuccinate lyase
MARVGYFMGAEDLKIKGIEFRKAHFTLGNSPATALS